MACFLTYQVKARHVEEAHTSPAGQPAYMIGDMLPPPSSDDSVKLSFWRSMMWLNMSLKLVAAASWTKWISKASWGDSDMRPPPPMDFELADMRLRARWYVSLKMYGSMLRMMTRLRDLRPTQVGIEAGETVVCMMS